MSALSPVSKELVLRALWGSTLTLVAASLAILLILVVRRLLHERRLAAASRQKLKIATLILRALSLSEAPRPEALRFLFDVPPPIVFDAALDILRIIEGRDAKRIAEILRHWGVIDFLTRRLLHGRRGQRIKALTLLAHFDDAESLALINSQTVARDPYVQLAAIRALAERGAVAELPRIIRQLSKTNQTNPVILTDVLCRFGLSAAPALVELATSSATTAIRVAALRALLKVGASVPLETIEPLVRDQSAEVRGRTVALLVNCDAAKRDQLVLEALRDPEPIVRVSAARAAGALNIHSAAHLLVAALDDENWWVRYRAAEALARFGDKGIQILKALTKGDGASSSIAVQVVAERLHAFR